jgi:hypothetical protein
MAVGKTNFKNNGLTNWVAKTPYKGVFKRELARKGGPAPQPGPGAQCSSAQVGCYANSRRAGRAQGAARSAQATATSHCALLGRGEHGP